jgi:hypothetical protein
MDCREVQDQLIEFHEDQLGPLEAERIGAHLEVCLHCKEELSAIEKVMEGLKSLGLPGPGEAFWRDFPKRVGEGVCGKGRPAGFPRLLKAWEGIYAAAKWLPLSKPIRVAVSVAAVVLIVGGMLFFRAGPFWTGSRGSGEETLEWYFAGMETVVSPLSPGLFETIPLSQLDDISRDLMGWLNGIESAAEVLEGNESLRGQGIFAQLEELSSEELECVYDVLRTRFFKSPSSLSMPIG